MPFGFEQRQREEKMMNSDTLESRQYLEVNALMRKDGSIIPLSFVWEDERIKVDRVISVKAGKSLKEYAPGYVFNCRTGSKLYMLGFDGERWYIII